MNTALVVTSIGPDQLPAFEAFQEGCRTNGWQFIVVGDAKSPPDFRLHYGSYLSRERHPDLGWRLGRSIPDGNYTLKNLGYLEAIRRGSRAIVESDDDNIPTAAFWDRREPAIRAELLHNSGWVNIYSAFTAMRVWPRGLPLTRIGCAPVLSGEPRVLSAHVQQSLADGNPDVDAIYRLVGELPITFSQRDPIALTTCYSPFNSQNTTWFEPLFPLLYLPTTCSFRMTDIWRGIIVSAWLHRWNEPIVFTRPSVFQVRNEHSLMRDFEQEIDGYLHNERIMAIALDCASAFEEGYEDDSGKYLARVYEALVGERLVEPVELELVNEWLLDLADAGQRS